MKLGIQYQQYIQRDCQPECISRAGFSWMEIPYELLGEYEVWQGQAKDGFLASHISGIVLKASGLNEDKFFDAVIHAEMLKASYIVLDTEGLLSADPLTEVIERCAELIVDKEIEIYLENGYILDVCGVCQSSPLSEMRQLKKLVLEYNRICGKNCFFLGMNAGYANLLARNLRGMVEEAGDLLKLVHLNDNDGWHNDRQMPFTYTMGRGELATDWYRMAGTLVRRRYEGWIVYDAEGAFARMPSCLYPALLELMKSVVDDWEEQLLLEGRLGQAGKKLILFGTGNMAFNYMCEWSNKYPVAFFVDNESAIWNTERYGVPIKPPQAILEIPKEERNVWICSRYYNQIGAQLRDMGVEYHCYNENYYK